MKQTAFFWDSNFVTWIIYKDYEGEGEKKKKNVESMQLTLSLIILQTATMKL